MHMRKKKWARPELDACAWFTGQPEHYRGRWGDQFAKRQPLHVEIGCGKGVSTAQMVSDCPETNFLALDMSPDVLGDARRNIVRACGGEPDNVWLARCDAAKISELIAAEDGVSRVYLSFSNPWPKPRHHKRRLTHPRQLLQYREFLAKGGEIWFKTDDDELFDDSLVYFDVSGFERVFLTRDLHASGFTPNWVSEHEQKYAAQGVPIKFGVFRKTDAEIDFDPLRWDLPDEREQE